MVRFFGQPISLADADRFSGQQELLQSAVAAQSIDRGLQRLILADCGECNRLAALSDPMMLATRADEGDADYHMAFFAGKCVSGNRYLTS